MNNSQNNTFSKEIELVLLCSSIKIEKQNLDRIKYLSTQNIDWILFKTLVIRNRIHAIVYRALKLVKENIPEDFMLELKKLAISTGTRSLFFTIFLQKLMIAFNKQGIFILPFKGPALAEQVYKDILLRSFSDLDILVDKSKAVSAFNLLKKKGLVAQLKLNTSQLKKYIKNEDHFQFYDSQNRITIEIHWEMSGLYLSKPLKMSTLKNLIITGTINETQIPCLSSESLLVYLCVHGAKHGWESLEQICSVAEIIKTTKNLDWEIIEYLSFTWGCKKMLLLGLYLSSNLLKAPVPDTLLSKIAFDDTILKIADKIINNLFNKASDKNGKNILDRFSSFHIRIRDSFIDRVRYSLRLIFRPTDKEWLYFPIPASVSFIHYFLRPCRLLITKLSEKHA